MRRRLEARGKRRRLPCTVCCRSATATASIPTTRAGLGLQSVTVDVSPPGYGAEQVVLTLSGMSDPSQNRTGDWTGSTVAVQPVSAGDLTLIGSTTAHLSQLRDTITIGRTKGRFDAIVIASQGNDLPVQSVLVMPVNGTAFAIDLRRTIAPGTVSDVIVLDPPDFLHEVTVTYATAAPQARVPTLEVRGRYAADWLGKIGENRQYAGGWILLGTVDVVVGPHMAAAPNRFSIAGQDGPFKKLRLRRPSWCRSFGWCRGRCR